MAEEKRPSADIISKWKKNVADPNVSEDIKSKFRNLLAKFGEAEVEVVKEVEKVVTPKGTRGRKPSATKKTTAKKPTGATRGRKPATQKSQSDIESAKAELKKKFGKTEEECEKIIDQYKALRSTAKKDEVKKQEATATNRTRIEKLKKDDNIIVGTDVKTADATIETAKEEVVAKIEQEIEIVTDKAETEATKVVEKDTTLTPTEKKEKVKKVVEKEVKDKTKVIVKRVIVDTSALLTAISTKLGEFDKDSQKEFLIKLRSDIDKLLTKYAFGGDVMGATQRMNITQSNMSSSSVNSFGRGGKTMYADGGLVEMFTANDDSDYVDDVLEQIKHLYSVNDDVLEEIVNDRNFDDVDELQMYFENAYFTYANTDADLGEEYVEMIGSISELGQDTLERYFDYRAFGRDLAYDYDEYSGHYFNQNYAKGGTTKSRRYDNGGGVDSYKIGDKFRVLKGIYGDYNSPRYANKEFEVINIRDGKYIDARTTNGTTETFDIKNIEKINFDNGGGVDGKIGIGAIILTLHEDAHDKVFEDGFDSMQDYLDDMNESGIGYAEYDEREDKIYTHSKDVVYELESEGIAYKTYSMFDNGGGVGGMKLPSNLKKRLDNLNRTLTNYGGRPLTEEEAIMWNVYNNSQSGFDAGSRAFDLTDAKDYHSASERVYNNIGDALIDISREMTGVHYDDMSFRGNSKEENLAIYNQQYKGTKSRYDNGGGVDSYKIGDKFRVLKGIYGDYNSPRYANKEFEVINIRDGKYIDARTTNGTTETFDIKNIEKINFDNGGGVGKVVWKTNKDMDSEGSEFNYYTAKIGIYDLVVSPNFTEYTSWKSSVEINSRVVGMMSESYSVKEAKEEAIRIANERIANDGRREKRLKGEMYDNGGGVGKYKKDWEVIGITMQGKRFKKIITLGRISDELDVKNALRRMTDLNISEVTSIKELKTYDNGGGVDAKFGGGGVVVFDNEGETYDRYTIFTPDGSVYGMSDNPMSPNGFNQYLGDNTEITMGSHLGKRLKSIPQEIAQAVKNRMSE